MNGRELAKKVKIALRFIPDKLYLQMYYFAKFKKLCNFREPTTFTEKLQWLKLYDKNPLYSSLVDKVSVRDYVEKIIGSQYLIPLIGGPWNNANEIPYHILPDQFVLKCTHDSGSVVICKNKDLLDKDAVAKKLNSSLKINYYWISREWPYKSVPPRIIAEGLLTNDETSNDLTDYKVMCFDGEPKLIQVHKGRFQNHTQDFYDDKWNKLDLRQETPMSKETTEEPPFLQEMLDNSRKLSAVFPQVRVDWYYAQGRLFFGELTLFDSGGFESFYPQEYNALIGSWIPLQKIR